MSSSIIVSTETPAPAPRVSGPLHHQLRIGYRLAGPSDGPVVVALGGISGTRDVAGPEGWWSPLFGPARAVDTDRYRVLSFDYLGAGRETRQVSPLSGPITPGDQAEVLATLLKQLGIPRVQTFVGASYGGMVGLAFASRYPDQLDRLVAISAPHRSTALATAWRTQQRRIIRFAHSVGRTAGRIGHRPRTRHGVLPLLR